MFTKDDIGVYIDTEMSQGDIVTLILTTPDGPVEVMGTVTSLSHRKIIVQDMHIQAHEAEPLKPWKVRALVAAVMEKMDVDSIEIQGATRTSGANPGRRPRVLRFQR